MDESEHETGHGSVCPTQKHDGRKEGKTDIGAVLG